MFNCETREIASKTPPSTFPLPIAFPYEWISLFFALRKSRTHKRPVMLKNHFPGIFKKYKPGKNTKTINPSKYNKNFKIHKKNKTTKKKLIF